MAQDSLLGTAYETPLSTFGPNIPVLHPGFPIDLGYVSDYSIGKYGLLVLFVLILNEMILVLEGKTWDLVDIRS